jgi:transcriptional regulator with XRE-family HTH domain
MKVMNESTHNQIPPFHSLGSQLRHLREQSSESLAEVSGAVEIEVEKLERIEQGVERPTEDILMLLISHFGVHEGQAVELWEMAGYDQGNNNLGTFHAIQEELQSGKPILMLMALDMRTMYSDSVHITINNEGVVMQFGQMNGNKTPTPVSRVGMSITQAENVLNTLQQALLHAKYLGGPKMLPPPTDHN